MVLVTRGIASSKSCELLALGQEQKDRTLALVDQSQLRMESLKEEYEANTKLYEEYFQDFPETSIPIKEVMLRLNESKYELDKIKMNQLVYVFKNILSDQQRSLVPFCKSRLTSSFLDISKLESSS